MQTRYPHLTIRLLGVSGFAVAIALATPSILAQIVDTHRSSAAIPTFDVTSIRPNQSFDDGGRFAFGRDELKTTATSLRALIEMAYGIEDDQIVGAPAWVRSQTYDLDAKVDGSVVDLSQLDRDQMRRMIRPLLAEYFKLKLHTEAKKLPSYSLVVAKGGPKLKEFIPADATKEKRAIRMGGRGKIIAHGVPIELLTQALTDELNRPVVDNTGLKGAYDFTLEWTPDDGGVSGPAKSEGETRASLFTALQEQLGLRLESTKGPVQVFVIDHVGKPSEH